MGEYFSSIDLAISETNSNEIVIAYLNLSIDFLFFLLETNK
jgi:hypothetical protein